MALERCLSARSGKYAAIPTDENDGQPTDSISQNTDTAKEVIDLSVKVAAARAVQILMKQESHGMCVVDGSSVYGIALAMPQIARSAGWSRTFTGLTIRSYMNLTLNFIIQGVILYEIEMCSNVLGPISGKVHLCGFGSSFDQCPGSADCTGPSGSVYQSDMLYSSFPVWKTRIFLRDSLMKVFPEMATRIDKEVHPGEYGMESSICRIACLYLFVLFVYKDFAETLQVLRMLRRVPTGSDPWISYNPPTWTQDKTTDKEMFGHKELDYIDIKVNGMPLGWKFVNLVVIVLPKLFVWAIFSLAGTQYIMDTAGIQELIINAVAMTFILDMDELIAARLCTEATKAIMIKIQGYELYDIGTEESRTDDEAMEKFSLEDERWHVTDPELLYLLFPMRLISTILMTAVFYTLYFWRFCSTLPDGSSRSMPLFPPADISNWNLLRWLAAPGSIKRGNNTWQMPSTTYL